MSDAEWEAHRDAQVAAANRQRARWARQRHRHLATHPRALWQAIREDALIGAFVASICGLFLLIVWIARAVT